MKGWFVDFMHILQHNVCRVCDSASCPTRTDIAVCFPTPPGELEKALQNKVCRFVHAEIVTCSLDGLIH